MKFSKMMISTALVLAAALIMAEAGAYNNNNYQNQHTSPATGCSGYNCANNNNNGYSNNNHNGYSNNNNHNNGYNNNNNAHGASNYNNGRQANNYQQQAACSGYGCNSGYSGNNHNSGCRGYGCNSNANANFGPYHSYPVRPALYGGKGLYNYRGYARHEPAAHHKRQQARGYSSCNGRQCQRQQYSMRPVKALALAPANHNRQRQNRHNRPSSYSNGAPRYSNNQHRANNQHMRANRNQHPARHQNRARQSYRGHKQRQPSSGGY